MRVLITGAAGFAGSHLAEFAVAQGAEVVGTVLPGAPADRLTRLGPAVRTVACDLTEAGAAARVLAEVRPDRVFHLAGVSVVGSSWTQRAAVLRTNVESAFQLLEGLRRHPVPSLLVSSGEVYGLVPEAEQPIRESRPVAPVSPYGLSKATAELYAAHYARAEAVPVVVARTFNHVGPRQARGFVWADVACQIAAIEKGLGPPLLTVGPLTTRRDFTDVRDVVRAYWLLIGRGQPGAAYNVASGRAVAIREVVDGLLARSPRPIEVSSRASPDRPIDLPLLAGDAGALRTLTGWTPAIPLDQSLQDVLDDWRRRV
jgi:GDP-4-dehydro-6-deoxy-D-mannose reductase